MKMDKNDLTTININSLNIHIDQSVIGNNVSADEVVNTRLTSEWLTHEYVSIILVTIIVPFILSSNVMIVTSVIKFKRLQMPTNYFIMSLAIADIVIAITLPFYVVTELTPIKIANDAVCLAANRILMTAGGVSILTLAVIAYDRYTAIMHPLEYIMLMTKYKIWVLVLMTWLYSAIITWIPVIIGWHDHVEDHSSFCTNSVLNQKSRILFIGAIFLPACSCIFYCYFRIFLIARHHAHAIAAVEKSLRYSIEQKFVRNDTKYAKTIAVVIGVFLLLWCPYQTILFLEFIGMDNLSVWIKNYLMLVAFLNSGINPWVYAYQNNDFRSAYRRISLSWCCRKTVDIELRRSSIISQISVLPASTSFARLNRANSRVITSDILYTLSKQLGKDSIESALNRRLSAKHSVVNAVSSLPDLLKLYANTYPSASVSITNTFHPGTATNGVLDECIIEECSDNEFKDSACSMTEFPSD